jgi:hypothetical protein
MGRLDDLRQKAADALSQRNEKGSEIHREERKEKPDPGRLKKLRDEYKERHNRWVELERQLKAEERRRREEDGGGRG